MSVNFEWNNDYSIGIDEIDSQHKRFLSLLQETYSFKQRGTDNSRLKTLVQELEKYLVFHTKSEEMLMILYDYPKQELQKEEHIKVITKVREKIKNLPENPEDLTDLLIYLMKWFVNHTTYLDKELGGHIQQQRAQ